MTQQDAADHWQRGATDSLDLARLAHQARKYALALFHCQLAVEKGLKAAYIMDQDADPPPTHSLLALAEQLHRHWTDEQKRKLEALSDFAILARYGDRHWEENEATEEASGYWIDA